MITRFAPSPTGPLHLGHAFSALTAFDLARSQGGTFHLRIEDIDQSRSRPEWERLIFEDMSWLGLEWATPVMRQSERLSIYQDALKTLWDRRLIFACSCNRKDIQEAASAPQDGAPRVGPDGLIYPGTCRHRKRSQSLPDIPEGFALRLDIAKATELTGDLTFEEALFRSDAGSRYAKLSTGVAIQNLGDIVVSRRDMGTSYHLSVVLDDAAQGITDVVRGEDLFEATFIHVLLQRLLGLPTPRYHHHRLIRDQDGKRLAKRDDARALRLYRDEGKSPDDIRRMVGL